MVSFCCAVATAAFLCFVPSSTARQSFPVLTRTNNIAYYGNKVYLSADNGLYLLDEHLKEVAKVVTDPILDNPMCIVQASCDLKKYPLVLTDNINKLLLVVDKPSKSFLIVCGSVKNGICEGRNLTTLAITGTVNNQFVASIRADESTAGVVSLGSSNEDVLYVGATMKNRNALIGSKLGSVTARILEPGKLFRIVEDSNLQHRLVKSDDAKDLYFIDYKLAFANKDNTYFATVQKVSLTDSTYHSKVIRICNTDTTFYSYTEIPLECRSNEINYNVLVSATHLKLTKEAALLWGAQDGEDLLVGLFAVSQAASKTATKDMALCSYRMKDVDRKLYENVRNCLTQGSSVNSGLPWFTSGNRDCLKISTVPDSPYCTPQTTFPIGGAAPMVASPAWTQQGTSFHSVAAVPHPRGLTIYLGDDVGQLWKLRTVTKNSQLVFGKTSTGDATPMHKISINNFSVYALTTKQVTKFPVKDCSERSTCNDCLNGPFCGWCSLDNTCTEKANCSTAGLADGFIDKNADGCPAIVSTSANQLSINIPSNITITARNLPALAPGSKYICSFNGAQVNVVRSGNDMICQIPNAGLIPGLVVSHVSTVVNVSIQANTQSKDVVATSVVLYNCNATTRCLDCTGGIYQCDWCAGTLSCVDNATSGCTASDISIPYGGKFINENSTKCPVALTTSESYIPFGIPYSIAVIGRNLPTSSGAFEYTCHVDVGNQLYRSKGTVQNGTAVICKEQNYVYGENIDSMKIGVKLTYGNKMLTTQTVIVTLFKCSHMRDDCSICADAPPPWKCGWCRQNQECTVASACSRDWTGRICPVPTIYVVDPLSGSVGGNTTVGIEGRNLGTYLTDIHNVTVAGYLCNVIDASYIQSKWISCLTAAVPDPVDGKVVVYVKDNKGKLLSGISPYMFSYKRPVVSSFSPSRGPCSGGTLLTINGTDLNVGRDIQVTAGGTLCIIDKSNSSSVQATRIFCKTSAGNNCLRKRRATANGGVVISFDGFQVASIGNDTFLYQPDPVVDLIQTNKGSSPLQTFASGGQLFNIKGQGFSLIAAPLLLFTFINSTAVQRKPCIVISDTEMSCLSPNVTHVVGRANSTVAVIGVIMDDIALSRLVTDVDIGRDPVFFQFSSDGSGVKELKTGDLILEGNHLEQLSKEDVVVTIGGLPCAVTSLDQRLVCTVPAEADVTGEGGTAAVTVFVGEGGLRYDLGVIKYFKVIEKGVPLTLYIAIAGGALFLVIIIVVLICLYRKRHRKEKKYIKIYQTQMDNLESRYARECKEAFADLQTEITDLTTDLAGAVPYLRFDAYAMQVLFPGVDHYSIHEKDCNKSDAWKRGMTSLCTLMKRSDFLLLFVGMLESQPSFQMRDRCKVASLLMVVLQDDLKYTTEILVELLADLIKKSVANGRPKLLLRRTESVAEKLLTNWLAYTLHGYLEEYVGEPLFHLCAAISALLDKEPVDAITSDARNSLSEDKLLRQKVDFQGVAVSVEYMDQDPVPVQLLNCDTIGQCKEKILNVLYKNAPYSERPSKDHLELSWVQPSRSTVVLQDDDLTNQVDGEWKRLNTLQHYQVPDNCVFRLAAPQSAVACTVITGSPVMHNSSMPSVLYLPNHSSMSALNNGPDSSLKMWHLVKASDFPVEQSEDSRQSKMMAEVYLTRLLKTKGTLQNFVTDLFDSIFVISRRKNQVPPPVKFLFDFLDKQALANNVTDEEVLHTWKNNSLPLRFWINVIKNPNFVFDIHKSSTVDSCLSVIAQLFMDSCSPDEHRLGKDSPSNKLLYAREIPEYKKRVARFYSEVQNIPPVNEEQMNANFAIISKKYGSVFNHYNAISELLGYAVKYKVKLMDLLEMNDLKHYADELQEIMESLPDD